MTSTKAAVRNWLVRHGRPAYYRLVFPWAHWAWFAAWERAAYCGDVPRSAGSWDAQCRVVSFVRRAIQYLAGARDAQLSHTDYLELKPPDSYPIGRELWLIAAEKHFGGIARNVPRRKVSDLDGRTPEELATGGMTGGDRMFHHNYGKHYARHLKRFVKRRDERLTIVEVGILKGTGLALWSKLFPHADLIGLDIDLSHFNDNLEFLMTRGAFSSNNLELHVFDQFRDNKALLNGILKCRKIDIVVDDGLHATETILTTARSVKPYLATSFVYFVEDNDRVSKALEEEFSNHRTYSYGQLTVITP